MYQRVEFETKDKELSASIREKLEEAEKLILQIEPSRHRSLAITHLEYVMLRANLAIGDAKQEG
jgi:hypothetical protein